MINLPTGTRIWIVAGITDMRNGFNGLASKVQMTLKDDPLSGHVFIFRAGLTHQCLYFEQPHTFEQILFIQTAEPALVGHA